MKAAHTLWRCFFKARLNIIRPNSPRFPFFKLQDQNSVPSSLAYYAFYVSSHLIPPDFISPVTCDTQQIFSFLLSKMLHPPLTSCLLGPEVLSHTLFLTEPQNMFCFNVRHLVSHNTCIILCSTYLLMHVNVKQISKFLLLIPQMYLCLQNHQGRKMD